MEEKPKLSLGECRTVIKQESNNFVDKMECITDKVTESISDDVLWTFELKYLNGSKYLLTENENGVHIKSEDHNTSAIENPPLIIKDNMQDSVLNNISKANVQKGIADHWDQDKRLNFPLIDSIHSEQLGNNEASGRCSDEEVCTRINNVELKYPSLLPESEVVAKADGISAVPKAKTFDWMVEINKDFISESNHDQTKAVVESSNPSPPKDTTGIPNIGVDRDPEANTSLLEPLPVELESWIGNSKYPLLNGELLCEICGESFKDQIMFNVDRILHTRNKALTVQSLLRKRRKDMPQHVQCKTTRIDTSSNNDPAISPRNSDLSVSSVQQEEQCCITKSSETHHKAIFGEIAPAINPWKVELSASSVQQNRERNDTTKSSDMLQEPVLGQIVPAINPWKVDLSASSAQQNGQSNDTTQSSDIHHNSTFLCISPVFSLPMGALCIPPFQQTLQINDTTHASETHQSFTFRHSASAVRPTKCDLYSSSLQQRGQSNDSSQSIEKQHQSKFKDIASKGGISYKPQSSEGHHKKSPSKVDNQNEVKGRENSEKLLAKTALKKLLKPLPAKVRKKKETNEPLGWPQVLSGTNSPNNLNKQKTLKCETCGQIFENACRLSKHARDHIGYHCQDCNKVFYNADIFWRHRMSQTYDCSLPIK